MQTPIAVVGVSALFPGSSDARGFWRDILAGRDLITDVPPSHWLIEDYYDPDPAAPDKTYCKRGAFLSPVDFDPMEFGVPPSIVPATDTAQLLALIVAQKVLEDASQGQFAAMDRERISVHPRRHLGAGAARLDGEPPAASRVDQGAARERHPRGRGAGDLRPHRDAATCPGRRPRSPGSSATSSPGASPTASISAAPTPSPTRPAPARWRRCRWAINELRARPVGPRDHRRRRHDERHLHVHVLQQDAGALAHRRLPPVLRRRRRHAARRGHGDVRAQAARGRRARRRPRLRGDPRASARRPTGAARASTRRCPTGRHARCGARTRQPATARRRSSSSRRTARGPRPATPPSSRGCAWRSRESGRSDRSGARSARSSRRSGTPRPRRARPGCSRR